jgi:hypothetical protein
MACWHVFLCSVWLDMEISYDWIGMGVGEKSKPLMVVGFGLVSLMILLFLICF